MPLFDAVLKWDKVKIQNLLSVGADPDMEAAGVVGGALVRELRLTTARQLALALGREPIVRMFAKVRILTQKWIANLCYNTVYTCIQYMATMCR